MLHFDWTITLGTVIAALVIVAGTWAAISRFYYLLDKRLTVFETVLRSHAETLITHAAQMKTQDDNVMRVSGDIREIMGQMKEWTRPKV